MAQQATAIKMHGGKAPIASWVMRHAPPRDEYLLFVDGCFGGGSMTFAHNPEGKSEIANDTNGLIVDFFRTLRATNDRQEFLNLLNLMPFSQDDFEVAQEVSRMPRGTVPRLERAACFFVANRMSRQGLGKDFSTETKTRVRRGMNADVSAWQSAVDNLPWFIERMLRVKIYNQPIARLIPKLDGDLTWFYLDPPYLKETRESFGEYGDYEWTADQHIELLNVLTNIEGKFLLSGYDSELYRSYAEKHGWSFDSLDVPNHSSGQKSKERKKECLWANYPFNPVPTSS